jgi:fatty acid desaturase
MHNPPRSEPLPHQPDGFGSPRTEGAVVATWLRTLRPETRTAIGRLHTRSSWHNLVGLLFVAVWVGAALVMHHYPSMRWPCYVVIGITMHSLANLMHEGIHTGICAHRNLNRLVRFLAAAPVLVSATAYAVVHRQHHLYNRTHADPDEITATVRSPRLLSLALCAWLSVGMLYYVLFRLPNQALRRARPLERRHIITEYGAIMCGAALVVTLCIQTGYAAELCNFWLIPSGVTSVLANVRGCAEHMMTQPGNPVTQTRTVTCSRLASFLNLNLNYHLVHHLFPGIPWHNLPAAHDLLARHGAIQGANTYSSYARFLLDTARVGAHGVATPT